MPTWTQHRADTRAAYLARRNRQAPGMQGYPLARAPGYVQVFRDLFRHGPHYLADPPDFTAHLRRTNR